MDKPLVGVIMGSKSDWETMQHAAACLRDFEVSHECRVVSAHRTPDLLFEYASSAESRGLLAIVAGAGGAAHLPGMMAAKTVLPVLGVPVESHALKGMDSLLSIAQMPAGVPVGALAIGRAGAVNAALLAEGIATWPQGVSNIVMTEWGLHVYYNIASLVKKTSVDGRGFPWKLAENAGLARDYGKGACPAADSLFERSSDFQLVHLWLA